MTEAQISPAAARRVVERMGETGQPPERNALAVNVGTGEYLRILAEEYLAPMKESGRNSSFKLVQAPFGGGKTQFLHCLREVAWNLGFSTALVGVSPQECPFDDPVKIYSEVARKLELPPTDPEEIPQPGIEVVLRQITEERLERYGAEAVSAWLRDEVARSPVESLAFRKAVVLLMQAVIAGDDDQEETLAAYLRGERLAPAELAPLKLRETIEPSNAFRILRSLVQVFRALDVPGVILLFDEMDRIMSLNVRRKKAIGDNLRQMIDHCGQSTLPSVLWVYAVPPAFMSEVVPEYPALEQRLKGASRFSSTSPLQPIIDLDHLPMGAPALFDRIGHRLLELYELGYSHRFDPETQRRNISALASELGESQLETGTRRVFVKAIVHLLGSQRRHGDQRLTPEEIRALSVRSDDAIPAMEGEEEIL